MNLEVLLPGGILEQDGSVNRSAVIREMTGKTQVLIGRKDLQKNGLELLDKVVEDCLVSYAGRDDLSRAVLDDMLVGDRDYLLLEIRKLSLGNKVTQKFTCENEQCEAELYEDVDLESLEILDLPDPGISGSNMTAETIQSHKGQRLTRIWTCKTEEGDIEATGRYLTCSDLKESMDRSNTLVTMQNLSTRILLTLRVKGVDIPGPYSQKWLESQPYRIVQFLELCVADQSCGPRLKVDATCNVCGQKQKIDLEVAGFFTSSTARPGTRSTSIRQSGSSAR